MRVLKFLGIVVLLLAGVAALLYFTGSVRPIVVWLTKPDHGWEPSRQAPPPDYASDVAWAAKPGAESHAALVPTGVEKRAGESAVDVFFVHPTGYLNGGDWNSPLNLNSRTEENTSWMLANQASAFNGCCNIWAPRYRETSIFRYFAASPDIAEKARALAYSDVERAFQYFLDHNNGRPFVIASHSQGTEHAFRLVKEHVDGQPVAGRMIAAYLIGFRMTDEDVAQLKSVKVCASATETGCLVHWATYGEGGHPDERVTKKLVCVNPLTWERDGARAEKALHKGGVPQTGKFSPKFWGDDSPQGVSFGPLAAPVTQWTWAECKDGLLFVADQDGGPFDGLDIGAKNYHGLDYPLFHMDIRANVRARASAYLQVAVQTGAAQPR